jgi:hypothetical protein
LSGLVTASTAAEPKKRMVGSALTSWATGRLDSAQVSDGTGSVKAGEPRSKANSRHRSRKISGSGSTRPDPKGKGSRPNCLCEQRVVRGEAGRDVMLGPDLVSAPGPAFDALTLVPAL